jgi:hypothetical protein
MLRRITSLAMLHTLAPQNPAYAKLVTIAAQNLGGKANTLDAAMRRLEINALETDEQAKD